MCSGMSCKNCLSQLNCLYTVSADKSFCVEERNAPEDYDSLVSYGEDVYCPEDYGSVESGYYWVPYLAGKSHAAKNKLSYNKIK